MKTEAEMKLYDLVILKARMATIDRSDRRLGV